jgi:hypothetical protein
MKTEDLIIGKDYLYKDYKYNTGCRKRGRIFTFTGGSYGFKDKVDSSVWCFNSVDVEELKDLTYNFNLTRFLIHFLTALTIVVGYGSIVYVAIESLKPYIMSPWVLFGLLVICLCALAASWACHVEGKK